MDVEQLEVSDLRHFQSYLVSPTSLIPIPLS